MAQNVTLQGADYPDVPSIILPKTGGGNALFADPSIITAVPNDVKKGKKILLADGSEATGTYEFSWIGDGVEVLTAPFYTFETTLDKTTYSSWSPSTTAGSILATANCPTFVPDMSKYEYLIEWLWYCQAAWPDGQTKTYCMDRAYGAMYQTVMRRPYGLQNFADDNWAYNYVTNTYTGSGYYIYWNSNGNKTWTTSMYGFYVSGLSAATLSSTSSDTPTITPKRPVVSAKCNSSYFTTTRAGQIDTKDSTIKIVGNLYRMDKNTSGLHGMWAKAANMYNHPL